ncbi:electron transfer flavoprotein subunit beta/FixA family protein [Geomonas sp. RF6]|uniref:electron transfer flavoprotein subunit beta/FixA family protein n=1 Tax=Geomonas sp. RF6 TaxID=2897342 RepID=UPI001E587166|nr:electron transfer flavoprotein subunit beta/FixA family protein [Geomonas sp. RF6]UFS70021.1 electron transfer flavoprotein subunit beta/FixA family protein [Geomonas sp. RF6]
MKILVCVKQVPDMESRFIPDKNGVWYSETDLAYRMNEFDEYAVEQAIRLKEQVGDSADVTVLSIGPDRVVEAIKKALAMGCDRGVHVKDPEVHLKDPWQVASIIAAFAKGKGFDIIFTGVQSQDRGSAQVGVTVAELIDYACTTTLVGFEYADGVVTARRELEGGTKGIVKLPLPALVTCQLGLNVPRYPTLPNIMKAKKKELDVIPVADLSTEAPLAQTVSFYPPAKKGAGMILEGEAGDLATKLYSVLKEKTSVVR